MTGRLGDGQRLARCRVDGRRDGRQDDRRPGRCTAVRRVPGVWPTGQARGGRRGLATAGQPRYSWPQGGGGDSTGCVRSKSTRHDHSPRRVVP
jgi:hypothetical protein